MKLHDIVFKPFFEIINLQSCNIIIIINASASTTTTNDNNILNIVFIARIMSAAVLNNYLLLFLDWQFARSMRRRQTVFLAGGLNLNLTSLYLPVKAYQSAEVLQRGMAEIARGQT